MVAARNARSISINYDDIIRAIDWNRVLLQAYAEHERVHFHPYSGTFSATCGSCIKSVLLRTEEPDTFGVEERKSFESLRSGLLNNSDNSGTPKLKVYPCTNNFCTWFDKQREDLYNVELIIGKDLYLAPNVLCVCGAPLRTQMIGR